MYPTHVRNIHRRQCVIVDGVTSGSEWYAVAGAPEGSVLGPSLFLDFTNDIPELLDSNCLLYADDLKVFRTVEAMTDGELLQNDLNRLYSRSKVLSPRDNIFIFAVFHK